MKWKTQPTAANNTAGTTMTDMAIRYALYARSPARKLPLIAQMEIGIINVMAETTAMVFRKVSISP